MENSWYFFVMLLANIFPTNQFTLGQTYFEGGKSFTRGRRNFGELIQAALERGSEAPFIVVLYNRLPTSGPSDPLCPASFVGRCTVVTTASCLGNVRPGEAYALLYFLSEPSEEESVIEFRVNSFLIPGQYNEMSHRNNIGLAFLECEGEGSQPEVVRGKVQLPSGEHINETAVVYDWHQRTYGGQTSYLPGLSELTVKSRSFCGDISDDKLCAVGNRTDSCYVSEGAPLCIRNVDNPSPCELIGIASSEKGCPNFASFTNILLFKDWIKENAV